MTERKVSYSFSSVSDGKTLIFKKEHTDIQLRLMQGLPAIDGLFQIPKRAVVSIGNFDGVHLGHQQMLRTAREIANARGLPLVFITFEPHPMTVLRPESAPPRLTPAEQKLKLLEAQGPDYVIVLPPEKEVLGLSAEEFWDILSRQARVSHLVEGPTFRFGRGAKGTVELLRQWSAGTELELHVLKSVEIALLDLQVTTVSSSVVRLLLAYGRARDAALCLGRPYALGGVVEKGMQRGRELGFPTANLKCDDQLVPADGVYVAKCQIEGRTWPVALSIGTNPTFGDERLMVEAHVIGFEGELYGQRMSIEVLDWLREQRTYGGVEPLKRQIERDVVQAREAINRDFSRIVGIGA